MAISVAVVALLVAVAAAVAANPLPPRGTVKPLLLAGTGTQTSAGAPNCQFTPGYCDVQFQGTAQFGPLSGLPAVPWNWTSNLRIYWTKNDLGGSVPVRTNGAGGFCAEAIGEFTVSHPKYGSFTAHQTGLVCEVGASGVGVPHILEGSFTITSSSGMKLAKVGGSGSISAFEDSGNVTVSLNGMQFKQP